MLERWPDICGSALGFAGEAARGLLRPQFFPPALAAKVSPASSPFFSILHLQGSHHVGGGRRQEGQKGDEDHQQEGKTNTFQFVDDCLCVQGGRRRDVDGDNNNDVAGDVRNTWNKRDFWVTWERGEWSTSCSKVKSLFLKIAVFMFLCWSCCHRSNCLMFSFEIDRLAMDLRVESCFPSGHWIQTQV